MALGAGLVGFLPRCWQRAPALGGPDLEAGVLGDLFCEHTILLLTGGCCSVCLVPAVLGIAGTRAAVSPA